MFYDNISPLFHLVGLILLKCMPFVLGRVGRVSTKHFSVNCFCADPALPTRLFLGCLQSQSNPARRLAVSDLASRFIFELLGLCSITHASNHSFSRLRWLDDQPRNTPQPTSVAKLKLNETIDFIPLYEQMTLPKLPTSKILADPQKFQNLPAPN